MDDKKQELSAELRMKLLEVEEQAAKDSRFDKQKGIYMAVISMGLFFTFGILFGGGILKSLIFGIFGGIVGFFAGAVKPPTSKRKK